MTDTATKEPGTGLTAIANLTTEIFTVESAEKIISDLRSELMRIDRDISTKKGRDAIRSMAAKIASTKTAADKFAVSIKKEYTEKANGVQAIRNVFWDGLEALQKEFRQPLTDFEEAEEKRIAAHEAALSAIPEAPGYGLTESSAELSARLDALRNYPARDWQEFKARAEKTLADEITRTEGLLAAALEREAKAAELERLRQEAAERARQEEAARIEREKKDAADRAAAQAKADAEAEARRKDEAEAARVADEQRRRDAEARAERDKIEANRQRAERERADAEARAAQAERDRLAAVERAKDAEAQAERDRVAAAEKAEADKQAAVLRERQKAEDKRLADEAAAAARAADLDNRRAVNRKAMEALIASGLSEGAARTAIEAIAKGQVPGIAISY